MTATAARPPLLCRWFGHRWFLPSLLNLVRIGAGERPVRMCLRCELQAPLGGAS